MVCSLIFLISLVYGLALAQDWQLPTLKRRGGVDFRPRYSLPGKHIRLTYGSERFLNDSGTYKIGAYTIVAILITFIGTTTVLFTPLTTVEIVRQDAWIAPFTSFLPALAVIIISCWLGTCFRKRLYRIPSL